MMKFVLLVEETNAYVIYAEDENDAFDQWDRGNGTFETTVDTHSVTLDEVEDLKG